MIFDLTQEYVPESYVNSRDYRVFLRELATLLTVFKYNIDHLPELYDADDCPDHLVPLLASMVGYNYNEDKSILSNRKIIKNFPYLIRNRGSELGIKLAVALSVNTCPDTSVVYSTEDIVVSTDVENGVITIYYPKVDVVDWSLIEVVRPVGMRIKLIKSDIADSTDTLELQTRVRVVNKNYIYDTPVLDKSIVNYDSNKKDEGY